MITIRTRTEDEAGVEAEVLEIPEGIVTETEAAGEMKEQTSIAKNIQEKLHSKQVLAEAQAKIQEKLKAMGKVDMMPILSEAPTHKSLRPEEASAYVGLTMNKTEQRLQELKNRIKGVNLPSHANLNIPGQIPEKKPEIELSKEQPEEKQPEEDEDEEVIVDPRLQMKRPTKGRRSTFKFAQAGEYQKLANVQRNTARLHLLQSEIETVAKQTGISSAVKLALVTPDIDQGSSRYLPSIEWWDEYLLKNKNYSAMPSTDLPPEQRYPETITKLIEHPIQLKAPDEPSQPPILKVYLTKKERKKLRRQNRRELQKEQMEKVRLGLAPPPEPKVKISNLMKVLGSDAIQDPTKMEAHVREQMANRLKKHLKANAERKLTDEQRSEKKRRKIFEDTSLALHVAIYRVKSLMNPSKKFKVETNAKQLTMTGCIILYKDINVIIVEGGPKQQKFYRNLMMNRLKWQEEVIIWEGIVKSQAFNDFKVHMVQSPKQARELLEKHGVGHYWDHAYSASMLLTDDADA
ncbi:hypothetical protein FO519_006657 [Halicephalobus sp. NKZ332]|nr:hypothetical protein FO519_006657 [Halicephalobus sp. NKZ332]